MFSLPFLFQKGINKTIQIYTQNARDAHIVHTPLALYCKKKADGLTPSAFSKVIFNISRSCR